MYKERWENWYFSSKDKPLKNKWVLIREIGEDTLSLKAQAKLEWLFSILPMGKEMLSRQLNILVSLEKHSISG